MPIASLKLSSSKIIDNNRQASRQARLYCETQLRNVKKRYDDATFKLAQFKERNNLISPDEQALKMADNLAELQADIDKTNAESGADKFTVDSLAKQLTTMPGTVLAETDIIDSPRVEASLGRLDDLYSQRANTLQEYTPNSVEVKALDARIAEEKSRLQQLAKDIVAKKVDTRHPIKDMVSKDYVGALAEQAANHARVQTLETTFHQHLRELTGYPAKERQLTLLLVEVDAEQKMLDFLAAQYQTLVITEQSTLPDIRMVSRARESFNPVYPVVALNFVLFLLLGLLFSAGLTAVLEKLDDLIHDQETAEKLTGLPTMGTIHKVKDADPKIIPVDDQRSALVDRFRVLRNNISFSSLDKPMYLIAVTSSGPGEGKTTCCTNLGIVMAMDGKRVLVVDCDLHRPSLHHLLNTPRGVGLTNVVMGTCTLNDAIVATDYPGLSFLPAGILPPNPSEVLNAKPTRQLFRDLANEYDLVILDCPPYAKLSDVQIISTIVNGVLLLVGINIAFKGALLQSYMALRQLSSPLIGLVINRTDLHRHRNGYYYHYGKYGYHYDYDDDATSTKNKKRNKQERVTK